MKSTKNLPEFLAIFLFLCLLLPLRLVAQGIAVEPMEWDFGDVPLNETSTVIVTITSIHATDLQVYGVWLFEPDHNGSCSSDKFEIISMEPDPTFPETMAQN